MSPFFPSCVQTVCWNYAFVSWWKSTLMSSNHIEKVILPWMRMIWLCFKQLKLNRAWFTKWLVHWFPWLFIFEFVPRFFKFWSSAEIKGAPSWRCTLYLCLFAFNITHLHHRLSYYLFHLRWFFIIFWKAFSFHHNASILWSQVHISIDCDSIRHFMKFLSVFDWTFPHFWTSYCD